MVARQANVIEASDSSQRRQIARGWAWLFAALLAAYLVVAPLAYSRFGWDGVIAASLAGLVCWLSGAVALLATAIVSRTSSPVSGVLLGTLIRTGGPFAAALALTGASPMLRGAGLFGMVLVFFFVTLIVETWLATRMVRRQQVPA